MRLQAQRNLGVAASSQLRGDGPQATESGRESATSRNLRVSQMVERTSDELASDLRTEAKTKPSSSVDAAPAGASNDHSDPASDADERELLFGLEPSLVRDSQRDDAYDPFADDERENIFDTGKKEPRELLFGLRENPFERADDDHDAAKLRERPPLLGVRLGFGKPQDVAGGVFDAALRQGVRPKLGEEGEPHRSLKGSLATEYSPNVHNIFDRRADEADSLWASRATTEAQREGLAWAGDDARQTSASSHFGLPEGATVRLAGSPPAQVRTGISPLGQHRIGDAMNAAYRIEPPGETPFGATGNVAKIIAAYLRHSSSPVEASDPMHTSTLSTVG